MAPVIFLRCASVVTFLFAAGHTLGALDSWSPEKDTSVLQAMRTFRFDVMGTSRTYWDFYVGFGLYISTLMFMEAVVLWQLGSRVRAAPALVRPIVGVMLVATLLGTYVTWRYIFVVPALFSLACAACLAGGYFTLQSASASRHDE